MRRHETPRGLNVRPAAVAGSFYPSTPETVRRVIDECFAAAVRPSPDAPAPKALIVPHAGYRYSGPIAASAYLRVAPAADTIRRVVLLGPSHRVALRGLAVSTADAFITPLGVTFIDTTGRSEIMGLAQVCANDQAHAHEHSLEVQLPFLQTVLTDFELLPLVVGQASPNEIAEVLDRCWGGDETLIVVSTDLSHYHAHSRAIELDGATAAAIARLDYEAIEDFGACGAVALRGLLLTASTRDLVVEQLDLRNSGDTAGDRDRVVGYGAFAVG